jgi:hypothetical protein
LGPWAREKTPFIRHPPETKKGAGIRYLSVPVPMARSRFINSNIDLLKKQENDSATLSQMLPISFNVSDLPPECNIFMKKPSEKIRWARFFVLNKQSGHCRRQEAGQGGAE